MPKPVKLFQIVILLFAVSASIAAHGEQKKPVKVFLLAGQSNMVGSGQAKALKAPYDAPCTEVLYWSAGEKKWVPLSPQAVSGRGRFGPEISFGHTLASVMPDDDIRLVKYAAGGTALYNDWAPTSGPQYQRFMATAKPALADLDASETKYEVVGNVVGDANLL